MSVLGAAALPGPIQLVLGPSEPDEPGPVLMDHIQETIRPEIQPIYTPLYFDKRYVYDGDGFWGFPERKNLQRSELWADRSTPQLENQAKISFLQNWLYFVFAH